MLFAFGMLAMHAFPQTTGYLYGLGFFSQNTPPYFTSGLVEYNTGSNLISVWNQFSKQYNAFGDHTIDPVHKRYLQVIGDSINMYLKDIDLVSGTVNGDLFTVDSVGSGQTGSVTIGGNINGTFYNCADGQVYFIHYKAPWEDSAHLAKVDLLSYEVTELATFPIAWWSMDNVVSVNHQKIYLGNFDYISQVSQIITYDITDNTFSVVNLSQTGFSFGQLLLTYNPNDGMLYGVDYDLDSVIYNNYLADLRIVKVNPETGLFTYLTDDFLANLIGANLVLDPSSKRLYFIMMQSNPGYPAMGMYDLVENTVSVFPLDNLNTSSFSANTFGVDLYALSKDCNVPTLVDEGEEQDCASLLHLVVTTDNLIVQPQCSLQQFPGLRLQIFDLLGRSILDMPVTDAALPLPQAFRHAGPYIYRFTNGLQLIKSGKMVMTD